MMKPILFISFSSTIINMRSFCFLIVLLAFAPIQSKDEWNQFKQLYNRHFDDAQEEIARRTIFEERLAMIERHNREAARGLHSYTMKINQFADLKREEIIQTMSNKVRGAPSKRRTFHPPSDAVLPPAVDWREKGAVTPTIENQGQCASDWAYTAVTTLESQQFLKTGKMVRLSAQNLLDCSTKFGNEGCNGGLINAAFQYIKVNKGIDTEVSYPYEARDGTCRFNRSTIGATDTGFVNIERGNETALQLALATIGPIGVSVDDEHDSFFFYESGVYDEPACSTKDWSHVMTVVGYDTWKNATTSVDYYIVKNSWGETWGWKGYVWMSRNKNNQCGIANWASYPLV